MLLINLILAHLIGDFLLQPKAWVEKKEQKIWKAKELYLHVLFHGILVILLLWATGQSWALIGWVSVVILVSHFFIDGLKLSLQNKDNHQRWFFIDQALHLSVIIAIWVVVKGDINVIDWIISDKVLLLITCVLFLTQPLAIIIKVLISGFIPKKKKENDDSLINAGKVIGMLERLLVFGFAVMGSWEGVGFLLAAKSVFRFGDLRDKEDRKLTEYILIGTLLSFGSAIAVAMIYKTVLQII